VEVVFTREQLLQKFSLLQEYKWTGFTKAVIANAHTSCSTVASKPSNISGAIHGNEPAICRALEILGEGSTRDDR